VYGLYRFYFCADSISSTSRIISRPRDLTNYRCRHAQLDVNDFLGSRLI